MALGLRGNSPQKGQTLSQGPNLCLGFGSVTGTLREFLLGTELVCGAAFGPWPGGTSWVAKGAVLEAVPPSEGDLPWVNLVCSPHHRASNTCGVQKSRIPNPPNLWSIPKGKHRWCQLSQEGVLGAQRWRCPTAELLCGSQTSRVTLRVKGGMKAVWAALSVFE